MRPQILRLVPAVLFLFLSSAPARAITLDDVTFYVGQGANRAALVLDWADGRDALIWGYRWDGSATGEDMFRAIVEADARLHAKGAIFDFGGGPVLLVNGIGYDRDGDGFAISDGTVFPPGVLITTPGDGATSTDADDSYVEGFNTGFWSYFIGTGNPYIGGSWGFAPVGLSDRVLSNGDFDGFAFAPGFSGSEPSLPVAAPAPGGAAQVPEPMTFMLGAVALAMLARRRRAI